MSEISVSPCGHQKYPRLHRSPAWFLGFWFALAAGYACATQYAYVGNFSGNVVLGIDTGTNSVVNVIPADSPAGVALNPAGTRLYVSNANPKTVTVIDTANNGVVATIAGGGGKIVLNSAGTRAYVADSSGAIWEIDLASNAVTSGIVLPFAPRGFDVNPAETHVYVAIGSYVYVIDSVTNAQIAQVFVGDFPNDVTVNPTGLNAYAFFSRWDVQPTNVVGGVGIIDTATNMPAGFLPVGPYPVPGGSPADMALNPGGTRAYVTEGIVNDYVTLETTNDVAVIDLATNTVVTKIPVDKASCIARNSADTRLYVTSSSTGVVTVIDNASNAIVGAFMAGKGICDIVVGPPGINGPPPDPPDLVIAKTHAVPFSFGQTGATYSITVSNGGGTPTTGTVTVVDTLPGGLTATAIGGTGWSCVLATLTCTRGDALASGFTSYPPITLTVDVAANAPASVTNTASVSGGGETNTSNNTTTDITTIESADLGVVFQRSHNFRQRQTDATFRIVVFNGSPVTVGTVTVTDTLPSGLTATAIGGAGWTCTLATVTCTRADGLLFSYSYIDVTVSVAANAPAKVTNTVTVSGGGDTTPANNTATDVITIFEGLSSALLWRHHDDLNYLWLMDAEEATAVVALPEVIGSNWIVAGTGDLDGDGNRDIVWYETTTGVVYVWYMNGSTVNSVVGLGGVGPGWTLEAVADLNGDGVPDILWRHSSGPVYVWYMNSGGTIASVVGIDTVDMSAWRMAGTGDLDGDGTQDIVWSYEVAGPLKGTAYVWTMNPAGGRFGVSGLGNVSGSTIAMVGDFDGDGVADILWTDAATGTTTVWYVDVGFPSIPPVAQSMPSVPLGFKAATTGDYNIDRKTDIVWFNPTTGGTLQWLMTGRGNAPIVNDLGTLGSTWFLPRQ